MSCSEGAQRLICHKQEEGSQSPRCGLPRLAAFGRDHKSGCSSPLEQRERAGQQLDFKGPIREQTLCCGHLYVTQMVQLAAAMCVSMIPKGPRSPMVPGPSPVTERVSASSPAQIPGRQAQSMAAGLFSASSQAPPTRISESGIPREPAAFLPQQQRQKLSARQPWSRPK